MFRARKFFSLLVLTLSLVVALGLQHPQTSAQPQMLVFGQETYTRNHEQQQIITEEFSVADPEAEFTLVVTNPQGKRGWLSDAVIRLNGVEVLSAGDLSQSAGVVSKQVTLNQNNRLEIELLGELGSSLRVWVATPAMPPPVGSAYIRAQPSSFPINTPIRVQFSYQFPSVPNEPKPIVELQRLNGDTGAVIGSEGFMQDNGDLSLGDDLGGDAIFNFRKTYNFSTETTIWLRAKVTVGNEVYYSQPLRLLANDPETPTLEQIQLMLDTLNKGGELYQRLLPIKGEAVAHEETVAYLNSLDIVAEATSQYNDGLNGEPINYGISISFTFGIGAEISTSPPGTR